MNPKEENKIEEAFKAFQKKKLNLENLKEVMAKLLKEKDGKYRLLEVKAHNIEVDRDNQKEIAEEFEARVFELEERVGSASFIEAKNLQDEEKLSILKRMMDNLPLPQLQELEEKAKKLVKNYK